MASSIATARTALAELLTTAIGSTVRPAVPDVLDGDGISLQPADPYLTVGDPNGPFPLTHLPAAEREVAIHVEVIVHVEPKDNEVDLDTVDDLLARLLAAMPREWQVDNVGPTQDIATADWTAYGCIVSVSTIVNLQTA